MTIYTTTHATEDTMNDHQSRINKQNQQMPPAIFNIMNPTFAQEYELARRIGDARFGSECKHEQIKGGRCVNCLRAVVS